MTEPLFQVLRWELEERVTFLLNGEVVGSANHDDDGWQGMAAMEKMFRNIAEELGVEVLEGSAGDTEGLTHE